MTRPFRLLFAITLFPLASFAQPAYELKDLFSADSIVWYGIDYSKARFIGTFEEKELHDYYIGWNKLVVLEPYKYDLIRYFHKRRVIKEIESVYALNAAAMPEILSVDNDSTLHKNDFAEMVKKYQGEVQSGIGAVLIAERYNRSENFAVHYVVVFDIQSKKVLISQRYTTAPDGNGLRNYWAGSIHRAMKLIGRNYVKWKTKYGR